MKKLIAFALISFVGFVGCKKSEGNKDSIKEESVITQAVDNNGTVDSSYSAYSNINQDGKNVTEKTYRYVAEDGSNALVTFIESDSGNKISVKSNNKVIFADENEATDDATIYKNADITIESKGKLLSITQGNHIIELKKAKGE